MSRMIMRIKPSVATGPPVFINAASNSINSASSDITCAYPSGSVSGNFLLLFAGYQRVPTSGTQTINTPSGWTQITTFNNAVGQVASLFWRLRGAETSVTVSASSGTSMYGTAQIHAYSNVNASPINTYATALNSLVNSTNARTMPSLTTSTNNCYLSYFYNADNAFSATSTWTNATELVDGYSGSNGRLMYGSANLLLPTAGTVNNVSWTPSSGTTSESLLAAVAIQT